MPNFLIFARILDYIYQIAMGILLSASMANAFDFKGETYGNGKNTKEVASAKKQRNETFNKIGTR